MGSRKKAAPRKKTKAPAHRFQPGDVVSFKGMIVPPMPGVISAELVIKPVKGTLYLSDKNTSEKGVMMIRGDVQRMMFLPDGTIYCHPQYGSVLRLLIPAQDLK